MACVYYKSSMQPLNVSDTCSYQREGAFNQWVKQEEVNAALKGGDYWLLVVTNSYGLVSMLLLKQLPPFYFMECFLLMSVWVSKY